MLGLPPESQVKKILLALVDETVTDLGEARDNIARWFDDAMHSVSGWYKRRAQLIVIAAAAAITIALNVDTIRITKTLWTDGNLRASLAAQAEAFRQANQSRSASVFPTRRSPWTRRSASCSRQVSPSDGILILHVLLWESSGRLDVECSPSWSGGA